MAGFRSRYDAFDRYQQKHRWLGFLLAVRQKYSDDQGGYLAATITYYGFFALFPLLLLFVTLLGYVLRGHPHLQQSILNSALAQLPLLGRELTHHTLRGNGLALAFGAFAALWAGMGACLAAENAMNQLWGVPFKRRPDFFRARGRAIVLLALLGTGTLLATGLAGLATVGTHYGVVVKIVAVLLSALFNSALFWVAFQFLVAKEISWRCLLPGAVAAGIAYTILQALGGLYVGHLKHANGVYGTFGLVLGLLSWIYLGAHITLLAAEGNVVATRKLWPRSFSVIVEQPHTGADRQALRQRSRIEERRQDQTVETEFEPTTKR